MSFKLSGKAAIAGVGYTDFYRNSGVTTFTLALRAIKAALDDAGLPAEKVDGVATFRVNDSPSAPLVAQSFGIKDLRYFVDHYGGGGSSHSIVGQAALAVSAGVADYVVCYRAINARSAFRMGGTGRPFVESCETQYQAPYGYHTPVQQYAMIARAFMHDYGITERHLGAIAMNARKNAELNPRAMMRTPMTYDDYVNSRMIVEPFRLFDCCLETDVGVAVVVCTTERARDLKQTPVIIDGVTWGGGVTTFSIGQPDLKVSGPRHMAPRLYEMAGLTPADVDVAMIYDCYTFAVLLQLGAYGFCEPGEAGDFVLSGATALDGSLPVNPHGGFLSEGYAHGMNHVAESVLQLRGQAGARQIKDARIAISTGGPGYVAGVTSAMLLRRDS
jgi:acetyl-CoA acetyltransferase